jgi:hypothetical protein
VAQIFISHSQRDEGIKDLFLRAFRGSGVTDIYREYEDAPPTGVTAELIERDIEMSSAVFVLLSETVQSLPHTMNWILFECGVAAAKPKPIWVFESYSSFGTITTAIPRFDHYVRFKDNDLWRKYIHSIAASFDDTPMLARIGSTVLGGALFGGWGALWFLLGGLAVFQSAERPDGHPTGCPKCFRQFKAHLPTEGDAFRCPNCGTGPLWLRPELVPSFQF